MSEPLLKIQQEFDWRQFQGLMREKYETEHTKDINGFYEFPFEEFPLTSFLLFLGPRKSGKSVTTSYMLYRLREKVHTAAVFCSSDTPDSIAKEIIPDCFVYDSVDLTCLQRIRARTKTMTHTLEMKGEMPPHCKSPEVLVILDDILHDKKKLNSEDFSRAILSGRHEGIGMWILLQYANRFPKELRKQLDTLVIKEHSTEAEYRYIHSEFVSGVIPDFDEFHALARYYTSNFGAMVIRLKDGDPRDISTRVFYMRSLTKKQLPPGWKLDAGTMFEMAKHHEKPKEETGIVVDYLNPNIFDFQQVCNQSQFQSKAKKKKGASSAGFTLKFS